VNMRRHSTPGFAVGIGAVLAAVITSACAWQTYAVTRAARHFTGLKTRVHIIHPLASSLRGYRVIELRPLANLMPGRVPSAMEGYLGARIAGELSHLTTAPEVTRVTALDLAATDPSQTPDEASALIVEGFLDDYNPGSRLLRVVELGFNHVAVTVRVLLRDKRSNRLVGAVSVTAEDDRETGTTTAAIDHVASGIGRFLGAGYAR
jgi:hypothetical protein